MNHFRKYLACALLVALPQTAPAASITLNNLTTSLTTNGKVTAVPAEIGSSAGKVVASGQIWTGGSGLGIGLADEFLAWCLDLSHSVGLKRSYSYEATTEPYSNSFLADGAVGRVSQLVNASYDLLDAYDSVEAAGFQLALWEVAYDDDFNLTTGAFRAKGIGTDRAAITAQAQSYLAAGKDFEGTEGWRLHFLQSQEKRTSQNLLTATPLPRSHQPMPPTAPVPLPAAGFMLLAGLGGLQVFRRRRA